MRLKLHFLYRIIDNTLHLTEFTVIQAYAGNDTNNSDIIYCSYIINLFIFFPEMT
jgi:hypothetical protein